MKGFALGLPLKQRQLGNGLFEHEKTQNLLGLQDTRDTTTRLLGLRSPSTEIR